MRTLILLISVWTVETKHKMLRVKKLKVFLIIF